MPKKVKKLKGRAIKMSDEKKPGAKSPFKTPPKSKPQAALWNAGNPPGGRNTAKSREKRLDKVAL